MLDLVKKAFCFYLMKIVLRCKDYKELDMTIDNIINRGHRLKYSGDENLLKVLQYAFDYRKYRRNLIPKEPNISNKVVFSAIVAAVF